MTLTPAKLSANQRNAQKSTGPKTPEGKAVSKMNAFKHGLKAQSVVVYGRQFRESPYEFKKLRDDFHASLEPVGPLEELLVDQIVQAQWRLRRALLAEAGEIAVSVDAGQWEREQQPPNFHLQLWASDVDFVGEMKKTARSTRVLLRWLQDVRQRVVADGELSKAAVKIPFCGRPNALSKELEELRQRCHRPRPAAAEPADRQTSQAQVLTYLDGKLRKLEWHRAECEEREKCLEQARQSAAVLPAPEKLGRILRYEAALDRQLYHAMNQLERLQRRRQGEAVPAPMVLETTGAQ